MSRIIDQMTPGQIVKAVRDKDLRIIKALVRDGVLVKKVWSLTDIVGILEDADVSVNISTVSRWVNGGSNEKNS